MVYSRGKASVALCNDWNPSLAQSSYFHWPAELRGVRSRNLEQSTYFATSPELSLSTFKHLLKTQLFQHA